MKPSRHLIVAGAAMVAVILSVPGSAGAQALSLQECVERALAQNPQIAQAHRGVTMAELGVQQASNTLLPTVSLSAAFSRYTSVSPQRLLNPATNQIIEGSATASTSMTYYTGLNLSESLYNPSMKALYAQATAQEQSARAVEEFQRQQLVLQVYQSYYGLLRAERNLGVALADVSYNNDLLRNVQVLQEMGSRSQVDLLRQENALAQAEQRLYAARNGLAIARAELNYLMAEDPRGDLTVVDDLEYEARSLDADLQIEEALRSHPSLRQARLGVTSSQAAVQAARSGRLPSVNLSGNYSWRGDSYLDISDALSRDYTWSVGVNVGVPLFDAFRTRSGVQRARVDLEGAVQGESAAERTVVRDVNRALLDMEESSLILDTARRSVRLAEETLRLSRELYQMGSGGLLELNASQLDLVSAQYQEVQALFNLKIAAAALDFATGGLH